MRLALPGMPVAAPATPIVYVREPAVWEYHQLVVKENRLPSDDALNKLGDDGWELSGVLHASPRVIYYFKRFAR